MPVREHQLLEREAEFDELVAALEDARGGDGRLVLVEGGAGPVVRDSQRAVLADLELGRGAAAAAGDRRCALGGCPLASLRQLSVTKAGGSAGAARCCCAPVGARCGSGVARPAGL